jgi:branched-chain amino acid transport system ATP-binding protein
MLKVTRLTKKFGQLVAVDDLSFEVRKGQIYGIAGPNGAGKSTVFNLIVGKYGYEGRIEFDGRRITGLSPDQIAKRGIARTFQIPQIFPSLTVEKSISVGDLLGKKRLMIGAALATRPKILMLDEPMAGSNAREIKHLMDLIRRINGELDITIIIIEHFMKVLTELTETLLVIESGRLICCDDPEAVAANPEVIECYLGDPHAADE